jgi:hypothetical protein
MRRPLKAPDISEIRPSGDIFYDQESMELARRYNERYLHWDRLQYHDCGRYGHESLWYVMKMIRTSTCKRVDISVLSISFNLPDRLHVDPDSLRPVTPSNGCIIPAMGNAERYAVQQKRLPVSARIKTRLRPAGNAVLHQVTGSQAAQPVILLEETGCLLPAPFAD